jgi:predicted HicB family RNase H-like nuclease
MAQKKINIPFRADEYSYRVQYSADDQAFIGLVDEFPGLSAFSDTLEGVIKEIKTVVSEGLRLLTERNEQIPEPLSRREYSGKFVVRLDPALHRQLAIEATRKGLSLNEHVREKLASV